MERALLGPSNPDITPENNWTMTKASTKNVTANPANESDTSKSLLKVGRMLMVPAKLSGPSMTPKYNGVSILKTAKLEANF